MLRPVLQSWRLQLASCRMPLSGAEWCCTGACRYCRPPGTWASSRSTSTTLILMHWRCPCWYCLVLQATRHLGLKSEHLNHAFFLTGCALFAALSLPINGADWAAQLGPWSGGDWCILLALGTVCYLGSAAAVQVCGRGPAQDGGSVSRHQARGTGTRGSHPAPLCWPGPELMKKGMYRVPAAASLPKLLHGTQQP